MIIYIDTSKLTELSSKVANHELVGAKALGQILNAKARSGQNTRCAISALAPRLC
jgi:hypothetical protein